MESTVVKVIFTTKRKDGRFSSISTGDFVVRNSYILAMFARDYFAPEILEYLLLSFEKEGLGNNEAIEFLSKNKGKTIYATMSIKGTGKFGGVHRRRMTIKSYGVLDSKKLRILRDNNIDVDINMYDKIVLW